MIKTYTYRKNTGPAWDKKLTVFKLKVEILEFVGPARARVKFLDYHVDGRGPGAITIVYIKNLNMVPPALAKRVELPKPGSRPDHYRDPYND